MKGRRLVVMLRAARMALDPSMALRRRSFIVYRHQDSDHALSQDWLAVGRDLHTAVRNFDLDEKTQITSVG